MCHGVAACAGETCAVSCLIEEGHNVDSELVIKESAAAAVPLPSVVVMASALGRALNHRNEQQCG